MTDIEQMIQSQINEIESQVPDEPVRSHEAHDDQTVIEHVEEETAAEMWQTTAAYTEEYVTRARGHEPTEGQKRRWSALEKAFRRNPMFYHVADCLKCDWVQGGWLNENHAKAALRFHQVVNNH